MYLTDEQRAQAIVNMMQQSLLHLHDWDQELMDYIENMDAQMAEDAEIIDKVGDDNDSQQN